ncbi:hypothetical protein ACHAXS_004028 [Conticribra weissflogii]
MFNLVLRQIDFVLFFTQAPAETTLNIELPQGSEKKYSNSKDHILKLLANLYGQKLAGRVWNHIIQEIKSKGLKLEDQGYLADYVDMNIHKHSNGTYKFTQQTLIFSIIQDVRVHINHTKLVQAKETLNHKHAFKDYPKVDLNFNYCSIIGIQTM